MTIVKTFLPTAVTVASFHMFTPSLGFMAADFGIDYDRITWSISGHPHLLAMFHNFAGQAVD